MKKIILPNKIIIKQLDNQFDVIITKSMIWRWNNLGSSLKLDWSKLINLDRKLLKYFKTYLCYRFKTVSISTVSGDIRLIKSINKLNINFPFMFLDLANYFNNIKTLNNLYYLRSFYKWGIMCNYEDFNYDIYENLKELKTNKRRPYEKVFLNPTYLSSEEVNNIYKKTNNFIYEGVNISRSSLRNNIILHISYELAPRPSQLHKLNKTDFIVVRSKNNFYYSLDLPMSKKIKSKSIEKRQRSLSKKLGEKIKYYLDKFEKSTTNNALLTSFGNRISSSEFSEIIIDKLKNIKIYNKSLTDLRHHLAQSLADQGSPAEIIAEILGHNSTVPARAYIAATPKIAEIKANALGKSEKYKNIISMLTTGKIIEKDYTNPERWVQGVIGNQYIGGIGSCGLPKDTTCPKNPVYACYTCVKFHPFKNGNHTIVKENLENQIQLFIDIAENGNDLEHNRPVTQLNTSISAVNNVIKRIENDYK